MEHAQEHILNLYYYTAISPLALELCSRDFVSSTFTNLRHIDHGH